MAFVDETMTKVPGRDTATPIVVSLEQLDGLKASTRVVIADVRWYLDGRDARNAFAAGRIPGAVFVDLDRDLARTPDDVTDGRHPFPTATDFAESMSRLGIDDDTHVIAYDDTGGMTASRLVVMLRMLGRAASLLDGGITAWIAAGRRLDTGRIPQPPRASFTPTPWPRDRRVSKVDMAGIVFDGPRRHGVVLLDARSGERFRGEGGEATARLDPRPGHIPGAMSAPWNAVVDADTAQLKPIDELRAQYSALSVDRARDVICYCGSGVSACLNLVAIEHAGLGEARLYVPSYSGWASNPDNRVETGESEVTGETDHDHERVSRARSASDSTGDPVRSLRRTRQRNRLAELEWFEALYRVYLAAFVFGGGILFLSGLVPDEPVSDSAAADVWSRGAGWLGLAGVLAVAMGLRSGSRGGPLSVEEADVRHLLLAPVDRRRTLTRPAFQRLRTIVFGGAGVGAVAGQLAGRRLPGSAAAWLFSGAAWGALVAALFVGTALVAHAIRLRGYVASLVGLVLIAWQFYSALEPGNSPSWSVHGPADSIGGLALWGWRSRAVELVPVGVALVIVVVGFLLLGRFSLEALSRRSSLVTQLRFAVTMQDLRTVTLLRRQLGQERTRTRPWIRLRRTSRLAVPWRRGWHGILRFPASRWARILVLAIVSGLCGAAVLNGTTAAVVGIGLATFILGLELSEPLAQEVDQGDRTDSYPMVRGRLYISLLASSIVLAVPVAAISALVMSLIEPDLWPTATIVAIPMVVAGMAGAAINIIGGAPDPLSSSTQQNLMPPEVAGTASVIKSVWPLVVSTVGGLPLMAARDSSVKGRLPEAMALRVSIAVILLTGLVAGWLRHRDGIRLWFNNAAAESRAQKRR